MQMTFAERAQVLAQQAFDATSCIWLPIWPKERNTDDLDFYWHIVVVGSLCRANKVMRSITNLLNPTLEDSVSAAILNRHLFECAANLVYMARDYRLALPEFLKKTKFPIYNGDIEQLEATLVDTLFAGVPTKRWKALNRICEELGWTDEFKSIYRVTSDSSHGGSTALLPEFYELHNIVVTDDAKANTVSTGLVYHLRIMEVAAKHFPERMDLVSIQSIQQWNIELGWQLANSPTLIDLDNPTTC